MASQEVPIPLSRLRLTGLPPNGIETHFKNEDGNLVIGFLFGAWESLRDGRKLYESVEELTRKHGRTFKCIYVSLDRSEDGFRAMTDGKPWLSCEWNDGSQLLETDEEEDPTSLNAGGERFHHSPHIEPPESANLPYSRTYLAERFDVAAVPTLVIYHPASNKIISRNVHPREISGSSEKRRNTMERWERGEESKGLTTKDVLRGLRWTLVAAFVAAGVQIARRFGGSDYDVIKRTAKYMYPDQVLA